ncbi:hypothetical protein AWW66_06905 [Micromonospora rosaria]|uniref:Uncharacterized protein n=2 Tax=Micromonospora rosaria TaxID=47874 RepID=A0A136PWB6_9ACTN|nr:hypothetical protein AWW66_06905 [Micromonospora rosaria]
MARTRQRRLWAVEGLTVFVCLVGLVAYLGRESAPGPETDHAVMPGGQAGVERPSVGRTASALPAVVSPGLNPRARPAPTPTATPGAGSAAPAPAPDGTLPAPARPVLDITRVEVPATVDLTQVGTRDWLHWGLRGADSTVRKRDGSGAIVDAGGPGVRAGHDTNPEVFAWRDGAEAHQETGTPTGVHTCGTDSGFALAVAGDGEVRTARLYVGVWMARGRLEARLPDGGPAVTVRLEDPHTEHTAGFDVRFQAPRGTRLSLSWITEHAFNPDCGSVSLQAVALR